MSDYLFDPESGAPDPEVAALEALLGGYAHRAPLRAPRSPHRRRWIGAAVAIGAAAVAAAIALVLVRGDQGAVVPGCAGAGPGFRFAVTGGAARCGGASAATGTLPVGAWLETARDGVVDVRVADIGDVQVYGDSRLRLVGTGPGEHRLELARGRLSARVLAPPRLFVIDTPVATAVDLGCAYELIVEPDGRTLLRVTSGAVSLEGRGRQAYVPMGTEVLSAPGRGPGTPVASDAAAPLRAAVTAFDAGEGAALAEVITAAGPRDIMTLWNLLGRTTGADRARVFAALDALTIRPEWVLEEAILTGDPEALAAWRASLDGEWMMR